MQQDHIWTSQDLVAHIFGAEYILGVIPGALSSVEGLPHTHTPFRNENSLFNAMGEFLQKYQFAFLEIE